MCEIIRYVIWSQIGFVASEMRATKKRVNDVVNYVNHVQLKVN